MRMGASPPSASTRSVSGFTLVELMVTLVLVGLLGTAVALTAPAILAPERSAMEQLAVQMGGARDEAILSGRAVRLQLDATGYRFEHRDFERWQPLERPPLAARRWPASVQPTLPRHGDSKTFQWNAQGGAEPGEVELRGKQGATRLEVAADGSARILAHAR